MLSFLPSQPTSTPANCGLLAVGRSTVIFLFRTISYHGSLTSCEWEMTSSISRLLSSLCSQIQITSHKCNIKQEPTRTQAEYEIVTLIDESAYSALDDPFSEEYGISNLHFSQFVVHVEYHPYYACKTSQAFHEAAGICATFLKEQYEDIQQHGREPHGTLWWAETARLSGSRTYVGMYVSPCTYLHRSTVQIQEQHIRKILEVSPCIKQD
ncbi:hypothetical protein F4805DRAFT_294184 [Annulohypoxylon moriforme]|nr:hypothetical protein F4805DRAFT_294184 [Annulohypoxylon moriforme]